MFFSWLSVLCLSFMNEGVGMIFTLSSWCCASLHQSEYFTGVQGFCVLNHLSNVTEFLLKMSVFIQDFVSFLGLGEPSYFYIEAVFTLNGLMMGVFFLFGTYLR